MARNARRKSNALPVPMLIIGLGVLLVLIALIVFAIRGSGANANANSSIPYPEIERVTLADARRALESGEAVFIDTRDASAFNISHIQGAVNIPMSEFESRISELDKNRWIIPYCT